MINARVDLIAAIKKLAEEMTYTIKDYEDEDGDTGIKWAAIAEDFNRGSKAISLLLEIVEAQQKQIAGLNERIDELEKNKVVRIGKPKLMPKGTSK